MADKDRLDRGLLVHLGNDDDSRPLYLGFAERVHLPMRILARRPGTLLSIQDTE